MNNVMETINPLMSNLNVSTNCNCEILNATRYGHTDIVRMLLDDPRVDPYEVTQWAAQYGYPLSMF